MHTNSKIHPTESPIGKNGGLVWNSLHSEREDICEAILKNCQSASWADSDVKDTCDVNTTDWRQELLQARLRKVEEALDRLMCGSYGKCLKCGRCIEEIHLDPAMAFCRDCWNLRQGQTQSVSLSQTSGHVGDSIPIGESSLIEVALATLRPFDTILVQTLNSDYRILLLEPRTGRALVKGGHYLIEPTEALVTGSRFDGSLFKAGSIHVGYRLDMRVDDKVFSTSRVQSITVGHHDSAESIEIITAQIQ